MLEKGKEKDLYMLASLPRSMVDSIGTGLLYSVDTTHCSRP